jgi:hypothetical protein
MSRVTLLLALALALACDDPPPPAPTVATLSPVRGDLSLTREDHEQEIAGPTRVEREARVATLAGARATLDHDGGASILLAGDTALVARLEALTLEKGRIWVDARDSTLEVKVGEATLEGIDATFAVSITEDGAEIYCGSGEVSYVIGSSDGRAERGEMLTLRGGEGTVSPAALWDDWTGGLADPARGRLRTRDPVGTLRGRAPYELGVARTPPPFPLL